jgi:hypothetical protein
MDEDVERGVIFMLGVLIGLLTMWLIVRDRESDRQSA